MPAPVPFPNPDAVKHTALEDAQGLSTGVFFCALGLTILTYLGLITGQMAGIAVILSYVTGYSFGVIFLLINLPFYWLAWTRMGRIFTLKSLGSVAVLAVLVELIPTGFVIERLDPALGALIFGLVTGTGLLVIFRHGGSMGGLGVVALLIQDRTNFPAGWVQLGVDLVIFGVAFILFPASIVLYSLLGAVVINVLIAINHRKDRYLGS
ncbi:MAG: YitT family protein [Pseudomonadota bacterium]